MLGARGVGFVECWVFGIFGFDGIGTFGVLSF